MVAAHSLFSVQIYFQTNLHKMWDTTQDIFSTMATIISKGDICPLKWDARSKTFHAWYTSYNSNEVATTPKKYLFKLIFHHIFLLSLISQVMESTLKSSFSSNISNWLGIGPLLAYNVCLYTCNTKYHLIVNYVAELFRFMETHKSSENQGKQTRRDKLTKWYAFFGVLAAFIFPAGFVFELHCWAPQKSVTLVGYWAIGWFQNFTGTLLTIIVFVINYWSWQTVTLAALLCYCGIEMVCTSLLIKCISTFWRIEKTGGTRNSSFERAKIYRSLQLIGVLQTEVEAGSLTTTIILVMTFAISCSSAIIVRLKWIEENQIIILISAYVMLGCAVALIVILGGHAEVWEESKNMFINLARVAAEQNGTRIERKWQHQFWLSCRNLIKVKFGVHNFVENETALNCLNWAIAMAVQFMLLGR